jgi:hypothetical protein
MKNHDGWVLKKLITLLNCTLLLAHVADDAKNKTGSLQSHTVRVYDMIKAHLHAVSKMRYLTLRQPIYKTTNKNLLPLLLREVTPSNP